VLRQVAATVQAVAKEAGEVLFDQPGLAVAERVVEQTAGQEDKGKRVELGVAALEAHCLGMRVLGLCLH
jgi:hypothetical protein